MSVVFVETLRRHLHHPAFLLATAFLALIAAFTGAMGGPANIWQALFGLMVLIVGCQLIGPEFSSGTLQLILSRPVNRTSYLVGRWAGVVVSLWIAVAAPFVVDLVGRWRIAQASVDLRPIAILTMNVALAVLLQCALFVLFGSFTRSYLNIAIYFGLQIILGISGGVLQALAHGSQWPAVAAFLTSHPGVISGFRTVQANIFTTPGPEPSLRWTMLVVCNSAVALLAASLIFRDREVPYGAD